MLISGECHLDEITFKADKGVFLEGRVMPAVEGVEIRSSHSKDPNVILKGVTDSSGKYRMGPVRNIEDFDIIAEKNGYKFEKTDELGVLRAIKLSQLIRPGEYFLRPILQEYQFEPKSLTININEGELETVSLKGHRFAYRYFSTFE
ncbi:unnamed protein product [Gongylonema pulchrum]|uniref:Carboxypeptidase regulatory-like domain-containing protein n=1 Tax=Gongylonema pulchrum TaxID=637853 RepID=A0A183EYR5_9BILA|nr:unnamed protein product [Gongylonema pulchrum]